MMMGHNSSLSHLTNRGSYSNHAKGRDGKFQAFMGRKSRNIATAKAKARPRTAEPGQPGVAVASESEDGENLVGKVPKTTSRKKK